MARAILRDRLQSFRLLSLVLALFTLGGVAITTDVLAASSRNRLLTGASVLAMMTGWTLGYRGQRFTHWWLPIEAGALFVILNGVRNPVASMGVLYVAIQFRALFGSRREATFMTVSFIAVLLLGLQTNPAGSGIWRPIVLIELGAMGFCGYLMHTLSEVLKRDQALLHALRQSEDRFRALFNNNPWPMWQLEPKSLMFLEANDAAISQYGYSREELLAMSLRDLRLESDWPSLERIAPELASERRFTHQAHHRKKDGGVIDVEITSEIFYFDGRRTRVAIGVDVTERKRAERALRESEQRFRSVIQNLREAVLITDHNDIIVLANARVRDVLGYDPGDLVGKNATELLLPEGQRHVFRDRLGNRLEGESELYETELVRRDGKVICTEISTSSYRDGSGEIIGTVGAISDITERKQLEERLREGMRMEVVGQLAGGVAHDFNNLLTVIKCHTELLLADLDQHDPNRESVSEIERSADRGAKLTQQLLAFSRRQFLQPRRIRLADVVTSCAPALRRLLQPNVALSMLHDDTAALVFADPLQLEHVMVALVRNANDALPNGGRIIIETRSLDVADEHTPVAGQDMPGGKYVMVSVSDTGVGMSGDVMARLFEPFFTTKGPGEGSGLGLASVYGVIRQSEGYVGVESAPAVGTTLRIYLPVVGVTSVSLPAASSERQSA